MPGIADMMTPELLQQLFQPSIPQGYGQAEYDAETQRQLQFLQGQAQGNAFSQLGMGLMGHAQPHEAAAAAMQGYSAPLNQMRQQSAFLPSQRMDQRQAALKEAALSQYYDRLGGSAMLNALRQIGDTGDQSFPSGSDMRYQLTMAAFQNPENSTPERRSHLVGMLGVIDNDEQWIERALEGAAVGVAGLGTAWRYPEALTPVTRKPGDDVYFVDPGDR